MLSCIEEGKGILMVVFPDGNLNSFLFWASLTHYPQVFDKALDGAGLHYQCFEKEGELCLNLGSRERTVADKKQDSCRDGELSIVGGDEH